MARRLLRLDDDELAYVMHLGGYRATPSSRGRPRVDDVAVRLIERLSPVPAYVQDGCFDVVAHNASFGHLVTDLDALPTTERNTMWLAFTDADWRAAMPDWESVTRRMVAQQPRTGHKVYDSPRVGRLRFDVATTWLEPDPGLRLLVHLRADAETEERLGLLEARR